MSFAASKRPRSGHDEMLDWLIYSFLLPPFVVVLVAQRLFSGSRRDVSAVCRPSLWAEAQSQASIATSYALWARSMLHSSERRPRPERLS